MAVSTTAVAPNATALPRMTTAYGSNTTAFAPKTTAFASNTTADRATASLAARDRDDVIGVDDTARPQHPEGPGRPDREVGRVVLRREGRAVGPPRGPAGRRRPEELVGPARAVRAPDLEPQRRRLIEEEEREI